MDARIARITYQKLKARQKENFNFQKVAAILAEYGFVSFRLSDDWLGADFIAHHNDGETFIKVQLKARFSLGVKYLEKNVYVAFPHKGDWYMFPHDRICKEHARESNYQNTLAWLKKSQAHSKGRLTKALETMLEPYKIFPYKDSIKL
jgi:hypothetical protein